MAEAKPLKIQRGDKSLDRANRVVATHIIFHTRRKKARLIPAHPGLEGTIRHTESYTALHKRLGSCPASQRNPGPLGVWHSPGLRCEAGQEICFALITRLGRMPGGF